MYFTNEFLESATGQQQKKLVEVQRKIAYNSVPRHNHEMIAVANAMGVSTRQLTANEGFIPRDVYQDFDRDMKREQLTDRGMPFINRLMPRAKGVGIGSLTVSYAQQSEVGVVNTSVSGQQGILADAVEHKYDGFPVLVHDTAIDVNWRQFASGSAEGYDLLRENNQASARAMNEHFATTFLDGMVDKNGSFINIDGKTWKGMRNDTHIEQVNLGAAGINFDFTDATKTGPEIKAAFIAVRDKLRTDNNYDGEVFFTISKAIESVWEIRFSEAFDSRTVVQELTALAGVAGFEMSRKLVGNQLMGLPESDDVRPLVGMAVNTIILPRVLPTDNYRAVTMAVTGWQAKNDFEGRKSALYASVIS